MTLYLCGHDEFENSRETKSKEKKWVRRSPYFECGCQTNKTLSINWKLWEDWPVAGKSEKAH